MRITADEVRYVASLANLDLTPAEVERMATDMDHILVHIEKLRELDTTGVEPMAQVLFDAAPTATLRPDVEHKSLSQEIATENAAQAGAGYFKVPRVIER